MLINVIDSFSQLQVSKREQDQIVDRMWRETQRYKERKKELEREKKEREDQEVAYFSQCIQNYFCKVYSIDNLFLKFYTVMPICINGGCIRKNQKQITSRSNLVGLVSVPPIVCILKRCTKCVIGPFRWIEPKSVVEVCQLYQEAERKDHQLKKVDDLYQVRRKRGVPTMLQSIDSFNHCRILGSILEVSCLPYKFLIVHQYNISQIKNQVQKTRTTRSSRRFFPQDGRWCPLPFARKFEVAYVNRGIVPF